MFWRLREKTLAVSWLRWALLVLATGSAASLACDAPAFATTDAPGWQLITRVLPTNLPPGGRGTILIRVYNIGAGQATGPATITDVLPAGLTGTGSQEVEGFGGIVHGECTGTTTVTCTVNPLPGGGYEAIAFGVDVDSGLHPGTLTNRATIAGGGAATPVTRANPVSIDPTPAGFGYSNFTGWFSNADGTLDTQAGSHPYALTMSYDLNVDADSEGGVVPAGGETRNITVKLPPGFVGDPTAVPQCPRRQFDSISCPGSTQIGETRFSIADEEGGELHGYQYYEGLLHVPVYNLKPPPGIPAQFGFELAHNQVFLDSSVRSGGDYGITVHADNIPQKRSIVADTITIWGTPADRTHDNHRGECFEPEEGSCPIGAAEKPLLTLPTGCEGPQTFSSETDTWENTNTASDTYLSTSGAGEPGGFTGCEHLGFGPTLKLAPDTTYADTPAGVTAEVTAPQEALTSPGELASSDIKNTTVTLPPGVVINPGQAAGLTACQESQANIHAEGVAVACPNSSRVGEDEIDTPLLQHSLKGDVYVLQSNPPHLRLLVTAAGEGVETKLVGDVQLDEATGQLTTTFSETPELPFEHFRLSFSGGAQAALATPVSCGTYTSSADFTAWGSPLIEDDHTDSAFAVSAGPGGGSCLPSPLPFSPELIAGATTDRAGGFTGFSMLLQRGDGQQRIERLQFKVPEGLSGMLSNVPLCGEPQASQGTCPASSHIGHASVASGPGPYPLVLPQPGRPELPIYLTGPYKGAPFGLSIVTHVLAGPFDLGTIVTRAKIEVDPITAQITVTTDPLPQVVAGVPTDLRLVNAVIDKPQFMFNPTNCSASSFSGTAWGTPPPGSNDAKASAAISSHFQVGSCRELDFKPSFKASTSGKTSRQNGASLHVTLSYPKEALGKDANIKRVHVELPKALPSRLSTLNHACLDSVFNQNPANCPSQSRVGFAKAVTPVLPVPLEGPAYFVSHGGAKFPELIIVLQGYGVTVQLAGETFIDEHTSVTSSTFKAVPDVPVGSFELTLPKGPYSALGANTDLCAANLTMPTVFDAQNGATLKQNTPISVEGCPYALRVAHRRLSNHTLTLNVSVPQAGKLTATGKGLSSATKSAKGRQTLTVTLKQRNAGKLHTNVQLRFTPAKGKQRRILHKSITVTFG